MCSTMYILSLPSSFNVNDDEAKHERSKRRSKRRAAAAEATRDAAVRF